MIHVNVGISDIWVWTFLVFYIHSYIDNFYEIVYGDSCCYKFMNVKPFDRIKEFKNFEI